MSTRMLAAAALAAATLLTGAVSAAVGVPAAVPSTAGTETSNEVTIAADGTYQVVFRQKVDVRRSTYFGFGGTIHDGFRLPDDDGVIPPYLRAAYATPEAAIEGTAVAAAFDIYEHEVSIEVGDDFDEGIHSATIRYDVTSAAVPTSDGYVVYIRPLHGGSLTITAADEITGVECVGIPPEATSCGRESDGAWVFDPRQYEEDAYGAAGAVKVFLKGDPSGIPDPNIDRG